MAPSEQAPISLLLQNYRQQRILYQQLAQFIHKGLENIPLAAYPEIISFLNRKKEFTEKISAMDREIVQSKTEWEKIKHNNNTLEAETLKSLLSGISGLLAGIVDDEKKLERLLCRKISAGKNIC